MLLHSGVEAAARVIDSDRAGEETLMNAYLVDADGLAGHFPDDAFRVIEADPASTAATGGRTS